MAINQNRVDQIKAQGNVPAHVAVIMDGNGRWARKRGLERIEGHKAGIESVRAAVEAAGALGVRVLTLYTFSSENWARPRAEVSALMHLLLTTIRNEVQELDEKNVRLTTIGDIDALPVGPRRGIKATLKRLEKNSGLIVNLALSYSGRQEIVNAVRDICAKLRSGRLSLEQIDEELISSHLQTHELGDPDLLVRTSGEMRISNFLLWQLAYTEIYITDILWPDFRHEQLYDAVEAYQHRERRFGRVSEQIS